MDRATIAAIADHLAAKLADQTLTVLAALDLFGLDAQVMPRFGAESEDVIVLHAGKRIPTTRVFLGLVPSLVRGASMRHASELALWAIVAEHLRTLPGWTLDPERDRIDAWEIAELVLERRGPFAAIPAEERPRWSDLTRRAVAWWRSSIAEAA